MPRHTHMNSEQLAALVLQSIGEPLSDDAANLAEEAAEQVAACRKCRRRRERLVRRLQSRSSQHRYNTLFKRLGVQPRPRTSVANEHDAEALWSRISADI